MDIKINGRYMAIRPVNYNNIFNLMRFQNGNIMQIKRFRFLADHVTDGGELGAFVPNDLIVM